MFAAALVCAAATVLAVLVDLNDPDYAADDVTVAGFGLVVGFSLLGGVPWALKLLKMRTRFSTLLRRPGDMKQVDAFLDAAGIRLAAMKSTDRPAGPLVSGAIHAAGWAAWADTATRSTGFRRSPLTWRAPHGRQS